MARWTGGRWLPWVSLLIVVPAVRGLDVLVNQVGYEPTSPKVFRIQRSADHAGEGTFSVRRVSDGVEVHAGPAARKGPLWNRWYWEGDFSPLRIPGEYRIGVNVAGETGTSYPFTIACHTILQHTGTLVHEYFHTQRCGVSVPGWHGVCHSDDGRRKDNNQQMDAAGGWHDAGDYNKFPHGFAANGLFDLLWLYESQRPYYDGIDSDGNSIPDILDEALHQARWLAKMVEPGGHVLRETQKRRPGASWVRPENDTDNVVGNSDDRWIEPGDEVTPQEIVVCAALIRMHRVLAARGLPTENFAAKALAIWDHRVALAVAGGGHNNLGAGAQHVFAGLDLHAVFGQQNCRERALQKVDETASGVIANPAFYDSMNFAEGPGYELGMLAWFARNYPSEYSAAAARTAVQSLMARYMVLADDAIGLIRRDDGGTLQYFPTNADWNGFFLGLNRLYLLLAWGATESYKAIGDPAYLRFAMDQYNWVMGANYNRVCMMEAAGDFNLPRYHTRYDTLPGHSDGAQPGLVPNGYVRVYSTGLPNVDLTGNRYQTNEGWLINNAAYAMALAGMAVFEDVAEQVVDTIPAQMYPGRGYGVSVTVRNSGYTIWDDQYRLGAVDDSDPFADGRQNLAPGMTVGAGVSHPWAFIMTAPTTAGMYTTDWRMVHEGVCWFGPTLSRQVEVVLPSTPPSVIGLSALRQPGRRVVLSWTNPTGIAFAGTMLRVSTEKFPAGASDGAMLVDESAAAGTPGTFEHTELEDGPTYHYAVFAHDGQGRFASAATATVRLICPVDYDGDGDVDQVDYGHFQVCLAGDSTLRPAGCASADLDRDLDVDRNDFAVFMTCLSGPNAIADSTCGE